MSPLKAMSGGKWLMWVLAAAILLPACAGLHRGAPPSQSPTVVAPFELVGKLQKVSYSPGTYTEQLKFSEYSISPTVLPAVQQPASSAGVAPAFQSTLNYTFGDGLYGLAIGPGRSILFSSFSKVWFGKLNRNGTMQVYTLPSVGYRQGGSITSTPDGAIWVAQSASESLLGRLSPSGSYEQFPVHGRLGALSPASDNSVWSAERDEKSGEKIVHVSSTGQETDYLMPKGELGYGRVIWGPDGALWFPINYGIGRLTTDGSYSRIKLAGQPFDVAFAADGTIWMMTSYGQSMGALQHWSASGTQIASEPLHFNSQAIAVAGDGTVWFTGGFSVPSGGAYVYQVGRFKSGRLDTYRVSDYAAGLVVDGNSIWFARMNGISMFTPPD